jgi:hypothetical protein
METQVIQNIPSAIAQNIDLLAIQNRIHEIRGYKVIFDKDLAVLYGVTTFNDCVHIATATVHKVDLLVSWNFKHIVNVYRIRGYNSINLKLGYPILNIHSPKEIIGYENEH